MFRALLVAVLLSGVLLCAAPAAGQPPVQQSAADNASVVAVHPNPVADEDRGEFVVVRARNATLSDGEGRVPVNGTAVLSPDPAAARNLTDRRPVREMSLALANGGERLVLARGNTTLDTLAYEDAPEGETLRNGAWRPPGATAFAPLTARDVPVHTFVASRRGGAAPRHAPERRAPPVRRRVHAHLRAGRRRPRRRGGARR